MLSEDKAQGSGKAGSQTFLQETIKTLTALHHGIRVHIDLEVSFLRTWDLVNDVKGLVKRASIFRPQNDMPSGAVF